MAETFEIEVNQEALQVAAAEFYLAYGHAMHRWGSLERTFSYWFEISTRLQSDMASEMYFGVRGFHARLDLIDAAITHGSHLKPKLVEIVREASKKARQYNTFRNQIAHNEAIPNINTRTSKITYLIQRHKTDPDPITVQNMKVAARNIHALQQALIAQVTFAGSTPEKSPEECLSIILGLPNDCWSEAVQTTPVADEQLPQDHRVNKKEHRAKKAKPPPEPAQ